jgi:hypothetical protein
MGKPMGIKRASVQGISAVAKVRNLQEPKQHWGHTIDPVEVFAVRGSLRLTESKLDIVGPPNQGSCVIPCVGNLADEKF